MQDSDYSQSWAFSAHASAYINETFSQLQSGKESLGILNKLRKDLSVEQARTVVEIAELRIRARQKFREFERMFFTRAALEMASSEIIANFKAERFRQFATIADICCGIGGDLISLARVTETCTGIDSDSYVVECANKNLAAYGLAPCAQTGSFHPDLAGSYSAMHIDPERRAGGRSTVGHSFSPPLDEMLALTSAHSVGIKVAPATRIDAAQSKELELCWIGHQRECKQQMIWSGELSQHRGQKVAISLDTQSQSFFSCDIAEAEKSLPKLAAQVKRYCFEPHNAVLAARLEDALGNQFNLEKFSTEIAYFTSDQCVDHGLLNGFETLEVVPASVKKVSEALARHKFSDLEIKKRGLPESFARQFKFKSKSSGQSRGTLILSILGGKRIAIVAKRLAST